MKIFNLPDLGEGLPDAEIAEWLVAEGDDIKVDQPMVSMETAKAVVEVPSPYSGKVGKLYGKAGEVIEVGKPLIGFIIAGESEAAPSAAATPEAALEKVPEAAAETAGQGEPAAAEDRPDTGTVVGVMDTAGKVLQPQISDIGGVKVSPAVRALAKKLKVDLSRVTPSGKNGIVSAKDVREFAAHPPPEVEPPAVEPEAAEPARTPAPVAKAPPAEAKPQPAAPAPSGEWEPLRGTRRIMARTMSEAHAKIVPTTLMDDADIHRWKDGQDITVRLLRALWVGARAEPGLNAWFDGEQGVRLVHKGMDAGIAVDTADGLFVAALRGIHQKNAAELRTAIDTLRRQIKERSIPPADLKDYTIVLSNFGVFAGRYATPVITPPCVAILAAGKLRHDVVPVLGGFEVHRTIPLSLTFDHRACTGGEAARFLRALIDDLALPE